MVATPLFTVLNEPVTLTVVPGEPVYKDRERLVAADTEEDGSAVKQSKTVNKMIREIWKTSLAFVIILPLIQTQI
jgi:hypothetical protein